MLNYELSIMRKKFFNALLIIIFISGTTHIFYIYFNYLKVSAEIDALKSRQLAITQNKNSKLDTLNQNMTHLQSKVEELTRELDKLQSAKSLVLNKPSNKI